MAETTKLQLRLPQDLKTWLKGEASRNDRSMNNQVVAMMRERMADEVSRAEGQGSANKNAGRQE